jgi:predicted transcriptional regulator
MQRFLDALMIFVGYDLTRLLGNLLKGVALYLVIEERWLEGALSTLGGNDVRGRRTLFEIIAHILGACQPKAKKTTLMYRCNMSFPQLTGYLDMMLDAQLLQIENSTPYPLFRISDKGRHFLRAYESLKDLMK